MNVPDHSEKQSIKKDPLKAGLYLLATPIGNLRDMSLRALDTLMACDAVICEDSRVSGKLLSAYGLKKEMIVYNDHASEGQRDAILRRLKAGQALALSSDAGTPLVSDPGYKLVRAALAGGIYVTALPGPCAPITALQLSGLPTDSFTFGGFLPVKTKARQEVLGTWKATPGSLIFFETAPRLLDSLADMLEVLGDRPACVMREMTKMFEEGVRGTLSELVSRYRDSGQPKGEIVVVIEGAMEEKAPQGDLDDALKEALKVLGTKEASKLIAAIFKRPNKEVYDHALTLSRAI